MGAMVAEEKCHTAEVQKRGDLEMPACFAADHELKSYDGLRGYCVINDICDFDFTRCALREGAHMAEENTGKADTDVPVEDLVPCFAYCCAINSLYCQWPGILGINASSRCLCLVSKCVACKALDCQDDEATCCMCSKNECYCAKPTTCCECTGQTFCCEDRCAFPCTQNVPCMFNVLGLTCCADFKCVGFKCCLRVGELIPRLDEGKGKNLA